MILKNIAVGTDIEEISRFKNKTLEDDEKFLKLIYTDKELDYCFSKGVPEQHLTARFCAKEAVVKALSELGISDILYSDIEILNNPTGAPYVNISKYPSVNIRVSLSHSKTHATANVIAFEVME